MPFREGQDKAPMAKYAALFRLQWQNNFVYRLNFVMWRLRNLIRFLLVYFFWQAAMRRQTAILGYQRGEIFTYLLGVLILQSLILSSRTVDVAGEILDSGLSTKLLKPFSYVKFWFTADLADKGLNILFAVFELAVLVWWLKPPLLPPPDPKILLVFAAATAAAFLLYFFINFTLGLIAFWTLEVWAPRFLFMVVLNFLAGGLFPIDILPRPMFTLIKLTPFPYLLYFPMEVYLNRVALTTLLGGLLVSAAWTLIMALLMRQVWRRGLRRYEAFGG
jgi:ABC-2 type transport system permease protein